MDVLIRWFTNGSAASPYKGRRACIIVDQGNACLPPPISCFCKPIGSAAAREPRQADNQVITDAGPCLQSLTPSRNF